MRTRSIITLWLSSLVLACAPPGLASDADTSGRMDGSTNTDATSETADSESGGGPPDMFEDECDRFVQDCPAGQKCVPYATTDQPWDANKCVDITGEGAAGDPCTWDGYADATDDCDGSSACYEGICRAFCGGTAQSPTCRGEAACLLTPVLNFCIEPCDPLGDDCPIGAGCHYFAGAFTCVPQLDELPPGAPCGYDTSCLAGACVTPSVVGDELCMATGCCTLYCELGDTSGCDALPGTSCVMGNDYALCMLP